MSDLPTVTRQSAARVRTAAVPPDTRAAMGEVSPQLLLLRSCSHTSPSSNIPHFEGVKFQRWALPYKLILRLFLLPGGDDAASVLKADIKKKQRLVLSHFHVPTANQTPGKEKPVYFELPVHLQAFSTEFWFCGPACESRGQEDHNTLMTWHRDKQPWQSPETGPRWPQRCRVDTAVPTTTPRWEIK